MEIQHLLRVLASPQAVAKDFASYCKRNQVMTRGMCRIGFIQRKPPKEAKPQSGAGYLAMEASQLQLRGLIANKDLKKDDNVVMLSERACIHPGRAVRCEPFMKLLPEDLCRDQFLHPRLLMNERLASGSLIRYHHLLMGLYMSYMLLAHRCRPDWAKTQIPGSDAIQYVDFMPRTEGDFRVLALHLARWLDTSTAVRESEAALAKQFDVSPAEVRPLLVYSLCMIFSRGVPVDHKGLLHTAFRGTPQEKWVGQPLHAGELTAGGDGGAGVTPEICTPGSHEFVKEPISFLCPILDMCNHSTQENVAVMVPSSSSASGGAAYNPNPTVGPVICLRTLRDIRKGEELTMAYGAAAEELKVVWGMPHILE